MGSVSSWGKIARKSQIVMVKASWLGKSFLAAAAVFIQSELQAGSEDSAVERCAVRVMDGEQPRKGLSLPTASLGFILESSERPGLLLFVKQQLTVHILCEKEQILCEYIDQHRGVSVSLRVTTNSCIWSIFFLYFLIFFFVLPRCNLKLCKYLRISKFLDSDFHRDFASELVKRRDGEIL